MKGRYNSRTFRICCEEISWTFARIFRVFLAELEFWPRRKGIVCGYQGAIPRQIFLWTWSTTCAWRADGVSRVASRPTCIVAADKRGRLTGQSVGITLPRL